MVEVYKFLNLLKRYKLLVIVIPVISIIITYFLVRNLKSSYVSQAQISTGIVDETVQQSVLIETIQGDQVRQQFSNLMEMIKMKRVLNQVSYLLIIHDLTSPRPFKPKSKLMESMNKQATEHALVIYQKKYNMNEELVMSNPDEKGLYSVLESMDYHSEAIKNKLQVFRSGESDFITVQVESENPDLSAFIVNRLSLEFIQNYSNIIKANQVKANDFLRNLLRDKTDTLANKMAQLRNYKIKNGVINLTEQSKQLYTLILEYDTKRQEAIEKTSSYAGALNEIDRKFNPAERNYIEAGLSKMNQSIINTKQDLSSLYNLYLNSDLDQKYKNSYDSLNNVLTEQISKSSDQYITNPYNTKQELITQKLNLEIQMDISRYSINSLENKIKALRNQFDMLVPKEAEVQTLEMNVDIASKGYLDILNKYNQNSLESGFGTKMKVVQEGVGGLAQPSKKALLVVLSGMVSFVFCVVALFLIFLFDSRIKTKDELIKATEADHLLGMVNKINNQSVDLQKIWLEDSKKAEIIEFKNQIRSIRFEIESVMQDKVLLISSVSSQVGKTFLSLNLLFAWNKTNLKILLIDGNFKNPSISESSGSAQYLEDFLQDKIALDRSVREGTINILRNRGGDVSLLEIASQEIIISKLEFAKSIYDLIIIESGSLNQTIQPKEWLSVSKDIIAVFRSGDKLSDTDKTNISVLKRYHSFRGWILNKVNDEEDNRGLFKI